VAGNSRAEINAALTEYLAELTDEVIRAEVYRDGPAKPRRVAEPARWGASGVTRPAVLVTHSLLFALRNLRANAPHECGAAPQRPDIKYDGPLAAFERATEGDPDLVRFYDYWTTLRGQRAMPSRPRHRSAADSTGLSAGQSC
jgi:hypothetical protein